MAKTDSLMAIFLNAGKLVLANWPIKLTALVLAVVLWAVVTAEETTTQLVDVTLVVQPPEGRAVIGDLPAVQARYRGTQRELLKLLPSPPVIRKDVPATAGSTLEIRLAPEDLEGVSDADVVALEVLPDSIVVILDDIHRKSVPVVSRVAFRPDSGHEIFGNVRISPSTVTLQGPEALVAPISSVSTTVMMRTGLTEDADYTVPIDTTGFGLVTVTPQMVRVMANIGPVSTHVLMGVAVRVEGSGGPWQSATSAVSVTVRGPAARVRTFTRDSVRVIARPTGNSDEELVPLEVIPPAGVTGTATPDSVVIRRPPSG
jgi:YbbR domain-containing protein